MSPETTTTMTPKRILVLQATTQHGHSVVQALASLNASPSSATDAPSQVPRFVILAQTRNVASRRAQQLASLVGVTLLQAPPEDVEMIYAAASTCSALVPPAPGAEAGAREGQREEIWGVFSVQKTYDEPGGVGRETRLGKQVADLAVTHGVEMFVYCSVNFGAITDRKTGVPQFEAKRLIEEHLEGLEAANPDFKVAVLRPAAFFDTFNPKAGLPARLMIAALRSGVKGSVKMMAWKDPLKYLPACSSLTHSTDLGIFASLVFAQPERFAGERLNLAGDDLTLAEMETQLEEVKQESLPASWSWLGWCVARFSRDAASVIYFLNHHGQTADLTWLRKIHSELKTWKMYVETEYGKE